MSQHQPCLTDPRRGFHTGRASRRCPGGALAAAGLENTAHKYSKVKHYPAVNQAAVKEMYRQVGDLIVDENGVALRGLLVRHLVLPEGLAGTPEIARFLAEEVSRSTYVNVMDQYRPCYKAGELPPLDRRTTRAEYDQALEQACEAGLHRFDKRELRSFRIVRI